jgi:16S rRNA (cytidine1402-2'-O)-methyltransferase
MSQSVIPSTLYIVATPIGNLADMTFRAVEILKSVDGILAEDPRDTLKLLQHYQINKKLRPYSDHSSPARSQQIVDELLAGASLALVSDAGTPGISDPGEGLVEMALAAGVNVVPVVGASAVTTLVSVFGKAFLSYHFWGFFPQRPRVQKDMVRLFGEVPGIHVYFESPYRVLKTFEKFILPLERAHVVVGREMTKKFESYYRGNPQEVFEKMRRDPVQGEYCVALLCQGSLKRPKHDARRETE